MNGVHQQRTKVGAAHLRKCNAPTFDLRPLTFDFQTFDLFSQENTL